MSAAPERPALDTRLSQSQGGKLPPQEDEQLHVVETPTSPFSSSASSRFEFEAGSKGNEGTKVLMVEWDTSAGGSNSAGGDSEWEVSWEGKTTVLAIRDTDTETTSSSNLGAGASGSGRRVFFFLPPGAPIPPLVSITQLDSKDPKKPGKGQTIRTKPLPAIYNFEQGGANGDHSGTAATVAGSNSSRNKRGVLHTIWAKKRLRELAAEIEREMRDNAESVGLEMALQEQQWIVDHFGLAEGDGLPAGAPQPTRLHIPQGNQGLPGPASPRSPIGGRLGAKLKGLGGLATSPTELAAAAQAARSAAPRRQQGQIDSLSPVATDVAVSSFGSMFNQQQGNNRQPPNHTTLKNSEGGGIGSLNAIMDGGGSGGAQYPPATAPQDDVEEDLFVLPMSPRSPEMKRSPFSIL